MTTNAIQNALTRRRLFWSTQPDGCRTLPSCGADCAVPGIVWDETDPVAGADDQRPFRSFSTDDWIRGYVLNLLMTQGRRVDTSCGYNPRGAGGHWSSSFIDDGPSDIGTLMFDVDNTQDVNSTLNLIVAFAQSTLDRMVERGVAVRVEVTGEYSGSNRFTIFAEVYGLGNQSARVNLTGERLSNGWVWQ